MGQFTDYINEKSADLDLRVNLKKRIAALQVKINELGADSAESTKLATELDKAEKELAKSLGGVA